MTKLFTVQFLVPDADNDNGISERQELYDAIQEGVYENAGLPGSFIIVDEEETKYDETHFIDLPADEWFNKYDIRKLADQCWPQTRFGHGSVDPAYAVKPNDKQCAALFRKWKQNSNGMTWEEFAATVVQFDYDAIGVQWCGMWLGIEKDGYTHS